MEMPSTPWVPDTPPKKKWRSVDCSQLKLSTRLPGVIILDTEHWAPVTDMDPSARDSFNKRIKYRTANGVQCGNIKYKGAFYAKGERMIPHGEGVLTLPNGVVLAGTFSCGALVS